MIIYVVRHELRYNNPTFFTSLTNKGQNNAEKLSEKFNNINFDIIFSSPFLRTIQTVLPYCKNYNKKINVEYSLYECTNDKLFNESNYHQDWKSIKEFIPEIDDYINKDYKSFIDRIKFPETNKSFNNRIFNFMNKIIKEYKNTNKKILIVSHMSPVIELLKVYRRQFFTFYEEGRMTFLYDSTFD